MDWILQRRPTTLTWMAGDLQAGKYQCLTLEDELRQNKLYADTAIPAGRYRLGFRDSPKFGADSIAVLEVPHFSHVLMHGGNDERDTAGCIIVGDQLNEQTGGIGGAKLRGVLAELKQVLRGGLQAGEVWLEIRNAPGDKYVDTGRVVA